MHIVTVDYNITPRALLKDPIYQQYAICIITFVTSTYGTLLDRISTKVAKEL